jgi:hypothetical protein
MKNILFVTYMFFMYLWWLITGEKGDRDPEGREGYGGYE